MLKGRIIIVLAALGLIAAGIFSFKFLASQKKAPQKQSSPEAKKFVRTEPVNYKDVATQIVAFGRVASAQPLDLTTEVAGKIRQGNVPLKAGQNFNKGALLFSVDNTEARLNLQSTKSNFLKQLASILPDFKLDFPESYEKWATYFSQVDVDRPLPDLPKVSGAKEKTYLATKDIFTQYYTIKSTEARLAKYQVYAPYSGAIAEVMMEDGSFAGIGGKIARIVRTDKLELKVPVETTEVQWVQTGAKVKVTTENGMQAWKGRVVRIGDVVNTDTQSIDVFVSIQPNEYPVFDGLYLKATIPGSTLKNAMVLPRNAVFNGNQVYTLEQDSILKVREVKIHKVNQETVVFSGLPAKTDVVNEPMINAYNNMKVFKLSQADELLKMQTNQQKPAQKSGEVAKKKS